MVLFVLQQGFNLVEEPKAETRGVAEAISPDIDGELIKETLDADIDYIYSVKPWMSLFAQPDHNSGREINK